LKREGPRARTMLCGKKRTQADRTGRRGRGARFDRMTTLPHAASPAIRHRDIAKGGQFHKDCHPHLQNPHRFAVLSWFCPSPSRSVRSLVRMLFWWAVARAMVLHGLQARSGPARILKKRCGGWFSVIRLKGVGTGCLPAFVTLMVKKRCTTDDTTAHDTSLGVPKRPGSSSSSQHAGGPENEPNTSTQFRQATQLSGYGLDETARFLAIQD
jgi:hypothetical protein